jgi:hypothetical protein
LSSYRFAKFDSNSVLLLGHPMDIDKSPTAEAVKLIHSQIDLLKQPFFAEFNEQKCLEHRLDRRQTDYLPDADDNVKILLAVSGAGKTRLLLELLHSRPGYYFVSSVVQEDDFGSADLVECHDLASKNPSDVDYLIQLLYLVRVTVCNYLIDLGYDQPHQLLLAQLHPKQFFGNDIFKELFQSLAKKRQFRIAFERYFDFVAIDEIQSTLKGRKIFGISLRPFFSPLIYYSKCLKLCKTFLISGTGINFKFIKELIESATMKPNIKTEYQLVASLNPLTVDQIAAYSREILADNRIAPSDIQVFVERVSSFPQCHGRARFISFIINSFLVSRDIELALSEFTLSLFKVNSALFPLRFFREDVEKFEKLAGFVSSSFFVCFLFLIC